MAQEIESGDVYTLHFNVKEEQTLEVDGVTSEHVYFTHGAKVPRQRVEEDLESGKLVRQT